jgi:hypothetical protein
MLTVPMAKGKIMMRFENIADSFDDFAATRKLNKTMVIEALWKSANSKSDLSNMNSYTVSETSITGNQPIKAMNDRRLHWNTVDDDKLVKKDLVFDEDDIVTLEPQRIRVFIVEFDS